jgi:O-antigen/teichoic acid export membrane protein
MLSSMELFTAVVGLGLPAAVIFYASQKDVSIRRIWTVNLAYAGLLVAVLTPLFVGTYGPLADLLAKGTGGTIWILAGVLTPVWFLDRTMQGLLLGELRFGLFNVLFVAGRALYFLATVALVVVASTGVGGALVALAAASVLMIVGTAVVLRDQLRPLWPGSLTGVLLRYGLRVQVGSVLQLALFRIDVVILQFFVTLRAVGQYAVATSLAELVIQLAVAFQLSAFPLASHYEEDAQRATTIAAVRHYGILALGATVGVLLLGPLVILYAFGPGFRGAIAPLLIMLPSMGLLGTGLVIGADLRGRGRPGLASILAGAAMAAVVALDLALIPPFGINGAALASTLAYSCFGLASLGILHRVSGIPLAELVKPTRRDFERYVGAIRSGVTLIRGRPAPS